MALASPETLDALKQFDSATVFNAIESVLGGSQGRMDLEGRGGPPFTYTDHTMRCLLPELGAVVGFAVTVELTTNDPDAPGIAWSEYEDLLEGTPGPKIAVVKDVDSRPGRGASFGDGMAAQHRMLGVAGAVVDGTVRDLVGIRRVGFPIWGKGLVPGHGPFQLIRCNAPIVVSGLLIHPGELLIADTDGVTKIPRGVDPADVVKAAIEIRRMEDHVRAEYGRPDASLATFRAWERNHQ